MLSYQSFYLSISAVLEACLSESKMEFEREEVAYLAKALYEDAVKVKKDCLWIDRQEQAGQEIESRRL